MAQNGRITSSGGPGGPAWTVDRRVQLFDSLEHRWPIGALLVWNPSGDWRQRWYLLDGHRRVDTLGELVAEQADLVRDLGRAEPTYLPAATAPAGGVYLPVNAMLLTMRLLPAIRGMSEDALDIANDAVGAIVNTLFPVITIMGGTPREVTTLCHRLLPGRVQPTTLEQIIAQEAATPHQPHD
jgi:hypothetical protein